MLSITIDADMAFFCCKDCHHDGACDQTNPRRTCPGNQQCTDEDDCSGLRVKAGFELEAWLESQCNRGRNEDQQEGAQGLMVAERCEDGSTGCGLVLTELGKTKEGLCNADSDGSGCYPPDGV